MSDDLVKRPRRSSSSAYSCQGCMDTEREEAADYIEKLGAVNNELFSNTLQLYARIKKLEAALRSIAANACCDSCREAALVAHKALEGKDD